MRFQVRMMRPKHAAPPLPIDDAARDRIRKASSEMVELAALYDVEQVSMQNDRGVYRISIIAVSERRHEPAGNYQRSSLPAAGPA